MRISKQTARRTWIDYEPHEVAELGLDLRRGQQVWHNMYHDALRGLMARGCGLDAAVRFILRGSNRVSFRRACLLSRGFARRAS